MQRIDNFRLLCFTLLLFSTCQLRAQEGGYFAIIPAFHDRLNTSGRESPLQLQHQRFLLFVYRNAVAVYTEADFLNTGRDTLFQELALPSTGHYENKGVPDRRISSGILSVEVWVEGERVAPEFKHDGDEEWVTIQSRFHPGIPRKVKAVFWAETSLANVDSLPGLDTVAIPIGKRGFLVDLAHATVWNGVIENVDVTVVLRGGLSFERDTFSAEPDKYDVQDSTLTWSFQNLEPSLSDNVVVSYVPSGPWGSTTNTMAKLSAYIVTKVYDILLGYASKTEEQ